MPTDTSALSWLATDLDRTKLRLPGTNRVRTPEQTLAMARRAAPLVGITRVADLTRLDTVGLPTFQAVRPGGWSLAVSQGKGATPDLAKLSALMEGIEMWHGEQRLTPEATGPASALADRLTYPVSALALAEPSVYHDGLPLDWVTARSLVDGTPTLVPVDVVRLSLEQRTEWNAPAFFESTNGLASGNTLVEAALHALYEVVERDAVTEAVKGKRLGECVDPAGLGSSVIDELCAMIDAARVLLEVRLLPSPTGLPCFLAWVACDDYPAEMYGFGCHRVAEIAMSRAVTEAVQTRLAYISGARDDLKSDIDDGGLRRPRTPAKPTADLRELIGEPAEAGSLVDDLAHAAGRVAEAIGHHPLVVDLSRPEIGVPVVKVVVPGARVCSEVM